MKLEENIYPYFPEGKKLPFYLTGIGGSEYQGHIIRPEGYQWHQILFCISGEGILKYGNETVKLKERDRVFLPKDSFHEYYGDDCKWEIRWISFDGSGCDAALSGLDMTGPVIIKDHDNSKLDRIFEKMLNTLKTDVLYCGYICSGLVYDMLLEFHRYMRSDMAGSRSKKLSTLIPALQYMHGHFHEDLTLPDLAERVNITPQHFCRLFKSALNMHPGEYLLGLRLSEAKRLLMDTDLPVAEISLRCGFINPGYFSTVFKKREGISPVLFRNRKNQTKEKIR